MIQVSVKVHTPHRCMRATIRSDGGDDVRITGFTVHIPSRHFYLYLMSGADEDLNLQTCTLHVEYMYKYSTCI